MRARTVGRRGTLAIGLIAVMALFGACGKKADPEEERSRARLEESQKKQYAAEKWMREGRYVPVPAELRQAITQALDKFEDLSSYRMGFYSQNGPILVSLDGEVSGGNVHLVLQKTGQQYPWEGFIVGDRLYDQADVTLIDHGEGSRAEGEKLYLPMYKELRVLIGQSMNGEVKDAGVIPYQEVPVHRYDFRVRVPDPEANLLTATVDLDESLGLIRHATIGQGTGSDSSDQRFIRMYRECQFEDFDKVPPVQLPPGTPIKPLESDRDALDGKLGLE